MSRRVELVVLHGSPTLISMDVQLVISSYLGPAPNMTLRKTCFFGSLTLLDWMWEASCTRASERTPWWSFTNFLRSDPHYYRYQFAESMKVAAKRGDLAVVAWLLEHFRGCVVPTDAVAGAANNGHLQLLNLLWDHDGGRHDRERRDVKKRKVVTRDGDVLAQSAPGNNTVHWNSDSIVSAAYHRRPDVVRWLHEHLPSKSDDELASVIRVAVNEDDLDLAKFLLPPGRCLLDYAEFCSNPKMIEWMLDCGYLARDNNNAVSAMRALIRRGISENLTVMRRIADQHEPPPLDSEWDDVWEWAMTVACVRGELQSLKSVVEHPTGVRVCENMKQENRSISLGDWEITEIRLDVDILQYLYEQGLIDTDTQRYATDAITFGLPLGVTKWMVDHLHDSRELAGCRVMDLVAEDGDLKGVQYFQRLQLSAFLRNTLGHSDREGCDLSDVAPLWCSTKAMDGAAANGYLEVVKWLHVSRPEGCTVAAMDRAASNGHLEVVKWLHTNRLEGCTVAAMDGAASNGHLEMLKWLHANTNAGCTTDAMDKAANRSFLEVLKWLHTNTNAGCTPEAMDNTARKGQLETLKWLHANTSEGCTVEAINNALRFGHFRVASWLHEHYPECVPTKLIGWSYHDLSFEELLFRQEHYGDIFTSDFLRQLRNPRSPTFCDAEGEAGSWVKEKYLGKA